MGTLGGVCQAAEDEIARMYQWFDVEGYEANIPSLREEYPDLTTFEQYLRHSGGRRPEPR